MNDRPPKYPNFDGVARLSLVEGGIKFDIPSGAYSLLEKMMT